jgi:hypothetical protein
MIKHIIGIATALVLTSSIGASAAIHRQTGSTYSGEIKVVNCTDAGFSSDACDGTGLPTSDEWTAFQDYSNGLAETGGYGFYGEMQVCDSSSCGNLKFVYEVP